MKILNDKIKFATIAFLLLATIALPLISVPASAHTPTWNVPTFAYVTAAPNVIGVNQQIFIVFWLDLPPPTAGGAGGDRWHDFTVTITKPDGTTDNKGPYTSDPLGSAYLLYTPTQLGAYTVKLHYSGQVLSIYNPITGVIAVPAQITSPYVNDTFLPSDATCHFTVQQTQLTLLPETPLPTSYWNRPINAQNQAWSSIASNWPGLFQNYRVQDDGTAPNSAHIMWTMPIEFGGLVGGSNTPIPDVGYYSGMSYEIRFTNAVILQGRLYFNMPLTDDPAAGPYTCVDLASGSIVWQKTGIAPTFGQLYDYESPNQHGVIPSGALFQSVGTTWVAYDPFSGAWLYNFTGVPSGTNVYQSDGSIARYILNYNATAKSGWLAKWTTAALTTGPLVLIAGNGTEAWQFRPLGKNADMSKNYEWNVTIAGDLTGSQAPSIVGVMPGDIILGRSSDVGTKSVWSGTPDPWTMWAIGDTTNNRGQILWKKNYPAPPNNITQMLSLQPIDRVNRIFTMTYFETGQRLGYSLDTGTLMWGPVGTPYQQSDDSYQYFSSRSGQTAYGELIVSGYGGSVFVYNTANGNKTWIFNDTFTGLNTPWGSQPTFQSMVADGKLFAVGGEHSPNSPYYKGEKLYAIDAFTGKELWNLTAFSASGLGEGMANMYIADGNLLFYNQYDNQIYDVGKGPSAVTVDAPMNAVNLGQSLVIRGTVTDQSPGAKKLVQSGEFNTVPTMSDAYMTPWMEYLYEQQPLPTNAIGVTVHLTAIDSNGNTQEIGNVTSDIKGNFAFAWQPPIPGLYKVTATFAGSNSYYGSEAGTSFVVSPASSVAPVVTPTPTQTTPTPTATSTVSPSIAPQPTSGVPTMTYVAIAAAVVIIAVAAAAVILRKRK